jgi:hypothetical protein
MNDYSNLLKATPTERALQFVGTAIEAAAALATAGTILILTIIITG